MARRTLRSLGEGGLTWLRRMKLILIDTPQFAAVGLGVSLASLEMAGKGRKVS